MLTTRLIRSNRRIGLAAILAPLALLLLQIGAARAAKPEIDPSYAEGKTYYMIGPHLIANPNPQLYAQSEELYLLVYPVNSGDAYDPPPPPVTLPSGYQPQCNPCEHPGLPAQFIYHDHVLTGAPGLGNHGTAGQYKGPWKIILLMYNPQVAMDPGFKPITRAEDIDPAEQAGVFLPINQGASNPYEIETGTVLICPFVAPDA
jgi:hypothetical protein